MDKDEMSVQDEKFRKLFLDTKIKAGENLKYRIIQQIETERVLLKEKGKIKNVIPLINHMKSVFGVMYALIAFISAGFCFFGEGNAQTSSYFMLILLVVTISIFFLVISVLDESRRTEQ